MWLDLRDIIEMPGTSKDFSTNPAPEALLLPPILGFRTPPSASGTVSNTAGVLTLRGRLWTQMRCVCDRCGREFDRDKTVETAVPLADVPEDRDDGVSYPLEGDGIDVDRVMTDCFLLDAEGQWLCRPDCKGLCPVCGKNRNDGPCGCRQNVDPRFAVLEQLLDK